MVTFQFSHKFADLTFNCQIRHWALHVDFFFLNNILSTTKKSYDGQKLKKFVKSKYRIKQKTLRLSDLRGTPP